MGFFGVGNRSQNNNHHHHHNHTTTTNNLPIVSHIPSASPYFTEFTWEKGLFYIAAIIYVVLGMIIVTIEPFLSSSDCTATSSSSSGGEEEGTTTTTKPIEFENALFTYNPCRYIRLPTLLYLTRQECMFGRRLIGAVVLGGIIGWERRQADRPAGIRTMALVSLGSCLFSLCSAFAFLSGPMSWDASRVSAAIPSGVGFLGSALIFKNAKSETDSSSGGGHTVQGLTTATSVWLSAAVGIACGGGLYFAASFCVAIMMVILRFGPRWKAKVEDEDDSRGVLCDVEEEEGEIKPSYDTIDSSSGAVGGALLVENDPERQSLVLNKKESKKTKKRRTLKKAPSLVD
eukprot:CAMPEP_0185725916 /NCGR_PEP_ID=MMETSP1171-20130828/2044_1 /TAXON_ID=374046 /ORGANISM="Helicotheca tamensis, Strain CCMP826" /LENGTH=344 /DNA_ID=CAMNT_0028394155 /DNA_START=86 /DNA_END=1120 /DNA_ORIENTATION=+